MQSLIETANANGVEPYAYLALVLTGMQYLGAKREEKIERVFADAKENMQCDILLTEV